MFSLVDPRPTHTCQGWSRRELLRIGSLGLGGWGLRGLGLGGLSLSQVLESQARAGSNGGTPLKGKSVVLLFLQGGPPHIEFFDPKMTAPTEIRSISGEIPTSLPGITFGSTFPKLAERAHLFTTVRSYQSQNGGHTYETVTTGRNPTKASLGTIYGRVAGANNPTNGMPNNILVLPEAVQEGIKLGSNFETGALPTLTPTGSFGQSYAAFNPSGGGALKENMQLRVAAERLEDRKSLLAGLDRYRRMAERPDVMDGVDKFQQQAFDVVSGGIADAFDLSKEDPKTLAAYDTSHLYKLNEITRWYDMARASNQLGKQMLLARRLCERGCGFVTVSDCGWDYHANGNSPKGMAGLWPMGHQVDHAVAAFIDDVRARGLEDKILLAVTGEMGRTPRLNGNGGRDHYGDLTSLLLFGGGLKMGQVIGQSDRQASRPATEPYTPENLFATMLNSLFDNGTLRITRSVPREIVAIAERARPIDYLF